METEIKWMNGDLLKESVNNRSWDFIDLVIVQVSSSLSVCFEILHNFQQKKIKKCREACLDVHFAVLSLC